MKRGKWRISLDRVGSQSTVIQALSCLTDFDQQMRKFDGFQAPDYLSENLRFDLDALRKDVLGAIRRYGLFNFRLQGAEAASLTRSYLSASLTCNPAAIDRPGDDPHQATLGSTLYRSGYASAETDLPAPRRNTYRDTYAFHERTPMAREGAVSALLDGFSRTIVRSRISLLHARDSSTTRWDFGWHDDEPIFWNLRVNIPIVTSPSYRIQIVKPGAAPGSDTVTDFSMQEGHAYAYDTGRLHRPYCRELCDSDRIHMIVGVAPWFDYLPEERAWVSNEFYGEMHPFEMFRDGFVASTIGTSRFSH